jgi:DNA-binding response OmpR family regulator
MRVLVVSADPDVREQMAMAVRGARRVLGQDEPFDLLEASDGVRGMALAWKHQPDVVVADEITSRAGAFALTKDLKGAAKPFRGGVVILLERSMDEWLAAWAGADAWFVKPIDPFALGDAVAAMVAASRAGARKEAG